MTDNIRLTSFSHGGGCGCKISPEILEKILKSNFAKPDDKHLLVGNSSKDDAAVYDLGNGKALVSTTDFFMPIVDDPYDFGRIAAANAISDIYAMGGKPLMAIAILGWPVGAISEDHAQKVIEGGRSICSEASIALAGGHSIDCKEPFFGLAVNGIIDIDCIKQNNTAKEGDLLFLTKPVGVGILATAQKRGALTDTQLEKLTKQLTTINKLGERLGKMKTVHALTDVTGFGVAGHLVEMTEGSGLSANLNYNKLPVLEDALSCLNQNIKPGATIRNWSSYGNSIKIADKLNKEEVISVLADPQTNGGLLISIAGEGVEELMNLFKEYNITSTTAIGVMIRKETVLIKVH